MLLNCYSMISNERSKNFTPMEWDNERCRLYQEEQLKKENLDLENNKK